MTNLLSFTAAAGLLNEQADQPRITPWAHVVDGPPPPTLGIDGDLALDRASVVGDWYERVLGAWLRRGQVQGPPGPSVSPAPSGLRRTEITIDLAIGGDVPVIELPAMSWIQLVTAAVEVPADATATVMLKLDGVPYGSHHAGTLEQPELQTMTEAASAIWPASLLLRGGSLAFQVEPRSATVGRVRALLLWAPPIEQDAVRRSLWIDGALASGVTAVTAPAYLWDGEALKAGTAPVTLRGNRFWEIENFGRDPLAALRPRRDDTWGPTPTDTVLTAFPTIPATQTDTGAYWHSHLLALVEKAELGTYEFDFIVEGTEKLAFYLLRPERTWTDRTNHVSKVELIVAGDGEVGFTGSTPGGNGDHQLRTTEIGPTATLERLATDTARVRGSVTVLEPGVGRPIGLSISRDTDDGDAGIVRVGPVLMARASKMPVDGQFPGQARALEVTAGADDWPATLPIALNAVGVCPNDTHIFWEFNNPAAAPVPPELKTIMELRGADWTARLVIEFTEKVDPPVTRLGLRLKEGAAAEVSAVSATQVWSSDIEQTVCLLVGSDRVVAYVDGVEQLNISATGILGDATLYRVGATHDGTNLLEPFPGRLREVAVSDQPLGPPSLRRSPVLLSDEFDNAADTRVLLPYNKTDWRLTEAEAFIVGGTDPTATLTINMEDAEGNKEPVGVLSLDGATPVVLPITGGVDLLSSGERDRRLSVTVSNDLGDGTIRLALIGETL